MQLDPNNPVLTEILLLVEGIHSKFTNLEGEIFAMKTQMEMIKMELETFIQQSMPAGKALEHKMYHEKGFWGRLFAPKIK